MRLFATARGLTLLLLAGAALASVPAGQADTIPLCLDPQFRIGPPVVAHVPTGTYWTPSGELRETGTAYTLGVWADNRAGLAVACVQVESTAPYDRCVCVEPF